MIQTHHHLASGISRRSFLLTAAGAACYLAVGQAVADEFDQEPLDANGYPEGYEAYTKKLNKLNSRYGAAPRDPSVKLDCPFARRSLPGDRLEMDSVTAGPYPDGYPKGAVIHVTEGRFESNANLEDTIAGGKRIRFAYFGISRSGRIYQTHSLERSGYHAGKGSYPGLGTSVATFLLGIEIAAAGTLRRQGDGFVKWWNEGKKHEKPSKTRIRDSEVRSGEVLIAKDREPPANSAKVGFYHILSAEQEWALTRLLIWLHENNPRVFQFKYVVGHDEVAPNRKTDPGSALSLSLKEFREFLEAPAAKQYIALYRPKYAEKQGFRPNDGPPLIKTYLRA